MDAAAHPTKPSTPPYGSPGAGQCISQSCRARRFDGRAAVMVASAPSTATAFELGVPIGHRARIIKEHKALHPELW